jgi:glycosyltransferase involved in cell wall biosynthesis
LTVAGDGPDRGVFERLVARYEWRDRVRLVGRIGGQDKWRLLASAQIVVMPSRYETFGTTALESMAAGTPVVAFAIPSLRDTISPKAGVLVEPFNIEQYGAAIAKAMSDVGGTTAAGAAGIEVTRMQSWDLVAVEHEKVYEAAVGHQRVAVDMGLRPVVTG